MFKYMSEQLSNVPRQMCRSRKECTGKESCGIGPSSNEKTQAGGSCYFCMNVLYFSTDKKIIQNHQLNIFPNITGQESGGRETDFLLKTLKQKIKKERKKQVVISGCMI